MRYDIIFIAAALACLVVGEGMGLWMGAAHDFALRPVHAHLNLVGWMTLALYGLIHRAYPGLAQSRVAGIQCSLAIAASIALSVGIAVAILVDEPRLAIVASFAVIAATLLFTFMFARRARA